MSTAVSMYRRWRSKRNFMHLVENKDARLLEDVGLPMDVVQKKLNTPFWRFS